MNTLISFIVQMHQQYVYYKYDAISSWLFFHQVISCFKPLFVQCPKRNMKTKLNVPTLTSNIWENIWYFVGNLIKSLTPTKVVGFVPLSIGSTNNPSFKGIAQLIALVTGKLTKVSGQSPTSRQNGSLLDCGGTLNICLKTYILVCK